MKRISILFFFFIVVASGAFAQCTVDVFINGVKSGQYKLEKTQIDGGGIAYKKSVYKNIDRLSIQISGKSVDGGYYRKIEVMGDDDANPIFTVAETTGVPGQFVLTDKAIFKRLKNGKAVKLFVEKTPANTKSKEAVRKVYIGQLYRS